MESKGDMGVAKFLSGYNCAQAVFYTFCTDLGVDKDLALKIACGFGAGMGRKEEVCGAVTGGIMVIGAKYGRGENEGWQVTEATYRKTRELMDRFAGRHGTYICRRLIHDCELMTDEGQRYFLENDLLHKVCAPCVRSVIEILEELL